MGLARTAAIAGGKSFKLPEYTGAYTLSGNKAKGYITLQTSGTLTLIPYQYDLCLVAGGDGGGSGGSYDTERNAKKAGDGGKMLNLSAQELSGQYSCVIGAGGAKSSYLPASNGLPGNPTTLGSFSSANGIAGGAGGAGKAYNSPGVGNEGGAGNHPFADSTFPKLGGGGGSGAFANGSSQGPFAGGLGADGGGNGGAGRTYNYDSTIGYGGSGVAGAANSGGGGGGGGTGSYKDQTRVGAGGAGGSGVIIVRWGY